MEQNALSQEAWANAAANKEITTEMLDAAITKMKAARDIYEAAKAASTEKYKAFEELEGKVIEAMTQAGKTKYYVENLGTAYFITKLVVTTPKTNDAKQKFFDYLRDRYGSTFLLDRQSINHQSLQKIYNDCYEEEKEAGRGAEFSIPGLEQPTSQTNLGFRKEK